MENEYGDLIYEDDKPGLSLVIKLEFQFTNKRSLIKIMNPISEKIL